jgi:uncharacterized protein (DUF697 family)
MTVEQATAEAPGGHGDSFSPPVRLSLARARQGRSEAEAIVKGYAVGGFSVGLLPLPAIDVVLLMDLQMNLIGRLADHYGVPFNRFGRRLIASAVLGALPVLATGGGLSLLKIVPVFGSLAGAATLSTLAAATTHGVGTVVMAHFEAGGTLDDLTAETLKRQLRLELHRLRLAPGT